MFLNDRDMVDRKSFQKIYLNFTTRKKNVNTQTFGTESTPKKLLQRPSSKKLRDDRVMGETFRKANLPIVLHDISKNETDQGFISKTRVFRRRDSQGLSISPEIIRPISPVK